MAGIAKASNNAIWNIFYLKVRYDNVYFINAIIFARIYFASGFVSNGFHLELSENH